MFHKANNLNNFLILFDELDFIKLTQVNPDEEKLKTIKMEKKYKTVFKPFEFVLRRPLKRITINQSIESLKFSLPEFDWDGKKLFVLFLLNYF